MKRSAAALHYSGSGVPRISAKGQGELAERIVALAIEAGIPIRSDADLALLLAAVDLDREIPEELYQAVAELLVFLRTLESGLAGG
jgi:flagellar biosynthesis protein